ncbi:hypothetical protein, partial [Pseudomonas sp. EL_65y_Pfl1_R83]|uniref:hypothetical protein n=1 Tax=Pseudomonas sp. EL_65y_Pfl1_R83 TaxID=3088697 RepID=UPI0030DD65A5
GGTINVVSQQPTTDKLSGFVDFGYGNYHYTKTDAALNVPLSFQTWRLLRHDQELTIAEARAVVVRLIEAILAHIDD